MTMPEPVVAGANAWMALRPTLTSYDGHRWDLSDPSGGVVLMHGGSRGWAFPAIDRQSRVSPSLAGSRWRRFRVMERDVFLPLQISSSISSAAFVALEDAFWAMLRPDRTCTLTVTLPDMSQRNLTCRVSSDGSQQFDMLPVRFGWANYGLQLVAERPYWQGYAVTQTYVNEANPRPPYPTSTDNYVLWLGAGSTLASATIRNPGDVEAYPKWLLSGPFLSASVGIGSQLVVLPFALTAGQSVLLDSDPEALTATREDGTDVTTQLGDARWSSVPPGNAGLSLYMDGLGSVQLTMPTSYLRAW